MRFRDIIRIPAQHLRLYNPLEVTDTIGELRSP
jgi:hypothetical protein